MTQIQTTSGKFIERKERRIYLADRCPVHDIRYQSFSKRKLKMGCRKCRSHYVDPNQVPLFNSSEDPAKGGDTNRFVIGVDFKSNNFYPKKDSLCTCIGQQFDGKTWVGDHLVGCPKFKVDPYDGFAGEEGI